MGWGSLTKEHARALAKLLLEDEAREWTPTLHAASGWDCAASTRRFRRCYGISLNSG